jgi:hypothetical protein
MVVSGTHIQWLLVLVLKQVDYLPGALELSPRHVRDLVAACPELLRRSPDAIRERHQVGSWPSW